MAVFHGNDFDESAAFVLPVRELCRRAGTARRLEMFPEKRKKLLLVPGARQHAFQIDRADVAAQVEVVGRVVDIGDAAGHARAEVDAGWTEHHDPAAGHVFAPVVADALDDRRESAVADREAFARLSVEEDSAGHRMVPDLSVSEHISPVGTGQDDSNPNQCRHTA